MRKLMIENAPTGVAVHVHIVENRIESALAERAKLQAQMVRARVMTRTGLMSSPASFKQLAPTSQTLVDARGGIGRCHVALAGTQKATPGIRAVAIGDDGNCPSRLGSNAFRSVA